MTYYESAQGITISKERAFKEVRSHGASVSDFLKEVGNKEFYKAQTILEWLGY